MSVSREQPLCQEDAVELSMALAAGDWWAIMEVASPISGLPQFGDVTWWRTLEMEEAEAPEPTRFQQEAPVPTGSRSPVPTGSRSPVPTGSRSPVPKSQDWRNLQFSEPLKPERKHQQRQWRQKRPQEAPAAVESPQQASVPTGSPLRSPVPEPLPRPSVPAPKPVSEEQPDNTTRRPRLKIPEPLRGELLQRRPQGSSQAHPQEAVVPFGAPKDEDMAPRIPKGALVNSGSSQGESLRIPKQQWQKQREQNNPQGASGNVGVCQPAPKNKICVDIVKKDRKPRRTDRIKSSHQHQISIPPRSQINRKRALDNAGVDRSHPHKMPRLATEVKDQDLEPGSLKKLCSLCTMFIHFCYVLNV